MLKKTLKNIYFLRGGARINFNFTTINSAAFKYPIQQAHRSMSRSHFSTFKSHKKSRKTSKQLRNKQALLQNRLENVPRRGAKDKYGKSKAEKRAHFQNMKQQKVKKKLPYNQRDNNSNKISVPDHYHQELPQYLPQNYHQLATEGDEAAMLSHFTADNDILSSQENQMSKLYDVLMQNRNWKKKSEHGYGVESCSGKTADLYLEIDDIMFSIDPNSKQYLDTMDNIVSPKVYERLEELTLLEEKYVKNNIELKHQGALHDKNYLYAKLVEGYATYASYRNENPTLQQELFRKAIDIYREMFRSGTLPTLPMYEALMYYELLQNNYEGVLRYLNEAQEDGYEITLKMANIKLMACANVELSPVHHTWGVRRTTNHILHLTEKCFVDHFNNVNGFFPNFKTFKALMLAYSRSGELQSAYRLMGILDNHSFIELSPEEHAKMFELLFEAHCNSIIVPRKERKRVKHEINRLKRIRENKTLAAPKLDWNFLRLSMFPKSEDNAVEKLQQFWTDPFGNEHAHDLLGSGHDVVAVDNNIGDGNNSNVTVADDELIEINDESENIFLIHKDDADVSGTVDKYEDDYAALGSEDDDDLDWGADPTSTVAMKYAVDSARAEAEFDGTYKEEDWVENPMDYMKDHSKSPQEQHIESIGLKELVSSSTDVQVLRSNYNEESVLESCFNCFNKMQQTYHIQPNIHHLNKLLRIYTSTYRLNRAKEFSELFELKYNIIPDAKTYKLLIEMYSRSNRFSLAKNVYEESIQKSVSLPLSRSV
jgi:hypothetical protein